MTVPSDPLVVQHELIDRAKQGDLPAFEQLLREHVPRIRRFARSMCANRADADDLAQEALLKAYLALRGYRFQSAFSTWLYRVVRNAFIDQTRKAQSRARQFGPPLDDASAEQPAADAPAPDVAFEREEVREAVWEALRQLPLEFRTALVLFDVEGLSHEEVAAVEGVAVGTIKSRLSRGRARLRELLANSEVLGTGNEDRAALVESGRSSP